jgi:hypothetical protein
MTHKSLENDPFNHVLPQQDEEFKEPAASLKEPVVTEPIVSLGATLQGKAEGIFAALVVKTNEHLGAKYQQAVKALPKDFT